MGLLDWFRSRPQVDVPKPAKRQIIKNVPALTEPILLFMESPAFVTGLSVVPSWRAVHVRNFGEFSAALVERKYDMLFAMSPPDDSGAAGRAIRAFREVNPAALTVFYGYDYRIAISGPRALACGADVLLVGGVLEGNLISCLGSALLLKSRHGIEPSLEFYSLLLKTTCAESPFWRLQDSTMADCEIE